MIYNDFSFLLIVVEITLLIHMIEGIWYVLEQIVLMNKFPKSLSLNSDLKFEGIA